MKASGGFSTMWFVASLFFSGGVKTSESCGRWIDPAAASARKGTPQVMTAPAAPAAADQDVSSVVDQYTVLGFI